MTPHLIIMAGGIGSRFWPMSTPEKPKQFIDIFGIGKTMLQTTIDRFSDIIPIENVWVVTSKNYKNLVKEQLPAIPEEQILLEPCMRNTAPCIAYVSYKILSKYPNANLVFSPADHIVKETSHFKEVIIEALAFTSTSNAIVTLGMQPDRPETGYGYIKAAEKADKSNSIVKIEAFKEKPNIDTAKEYLKSGNYFWNAGIFIWNVNTVVAAFKTYVPELAERFETLQNKGVFYSKNEQDIIDREFPECPNISIDYAIMEKHTNTYVYPASFGWSDVGTWGSLYTHLAKDTDGNATIGNNVILINCKRCIVYVPDQQKVVIEGLSDYIITQKNDKLLLCKIDDEQHIKEWVNK